MIKVNICAIFIEELAKLKGKRKVINSNYRLS